MNLFDYVNSILENKKDLSDEPNFEQEYSPYLVNKALSMYPDTLLYANLMNSHPTMNKEMHYRYLLHSIRPKKRFSKWPKNIVDEDLKYIRRFFKTSYVKAKDYKTILSKADIEKIVAFEKSKEEEND